LGLTEFLNGYQGIYFSELISMSKSYNNTPVCVESWNYYSGIAKILISIFYLVVSIMIIRKKPLPILLFYWVAGASILFGMLNGVLVIFTSTFLNFAFMITVFFDVILYTILVLVVVKGNKEGFKKYKTT
jgi:hypothetical protein